MKKFAILIALILVISMFFATVVMAEESSSKGGRKAGAISIKAGVTIIPDKDFTIGDTTYTYPGRNGFTLEGDVVVYSTDYIDVDGVIGFFYNAEETYTGIEPTYVEQFRGGKMTNLYYMGGVNIFPTKEKFYIGIHAGGITTYYGDFVYTDSHGQQINITGLDSDTNFIFRVGAGIQTEHIVFEASYILIHEQ